MSLGLATQLGPGEETVEPSSDTSSILNLVITHGTPILRVLAQASYVVLLVLNLTQNRHPTASASTDHYFIGTTRDSW
jgi:hypothetical protein